MSDQDQPSKHTSSVPLKKETVRVTLKAADAPSASPTGAAPAPAAPKPTAPQPPTAAPKPPTAAPKPPTAGAPPAAPVATKPAATGPAPAPAPTIQLKTAGGAAPAAPGARPAPAPTIKLNTPGAGASSPSLPKATIQLQPPTSPGGATSPAASQMAAFGAEDDEDEAVDSPVIVGLSILAAVAAAVVLFLQISTAKVWLGTNENGGQQDVEWSQLF